MGVPLELRFTLTIWVPYVNKQHRKTMKKTNVTNFNM